MHPGIPHPCSVLPRGRGTPWGRAPRPSQPLGAEAMARTWGCRCPWRGARPAPAPAPAPRRPAPAAAAATRGRPPWPGPRGEARSCPEPAVLNAPPAPQRPPPSAAKAPAPAPGGGAQGLRGAGRGAEPDSGRRGHCWAGSREGG